jgi:hypothetical protein
VLYEEGNYSAGNKRRIRPSASKKQLWQRHAEIDQKNNKKALLCVIENSYTAEGYRIKT